MSAVLDTHAALWYLLDTKNLSPTAAALIDEAARNGSPAYLSAISLVEVIYLVERGRLPFDASERLRKELHSEQPAFRIVHLDTAIAEAVSLIPRAAVPDMPDRIIAATAVHLNLPLVTRDRRLQAAGIRTVW